MDKSYRAEQAPVGALPVRNPVDAAFNKVFAGGEPTFEVRVADSLEGTFTRTRLIADNAEGDPALAEWARVCSVGNFYQTGGGAAPVFVVTRVL